MEACFFFDDHDPAKRPVHHQSEDDPAVFLTGHASSGNIKRGSPFVTTCPIAVRRRGAAVVATEASLHRSWTYAASDNNVMPTNIKKARIKFKSIGHRFRKCVPTPCRKFLRDPQAVERDQHADVNHIREHVLSGDASHAHCVGSFVLKANGVVCRGEKLFRSTSLRYQRRDEHQNEK